jgi:FkbM family methyltransferase
MLKKLTLYYAYIFINFLFTTNLNADNSDLLENAVRVAQNGYEVLANFLDQDDSIIYESDFEYFKSFPFSSYNLVSVKTQGSFFINNVNDSIKNHLRKNLCWEPENKSLIMKYVKNGSIVLDIGAHIGTHTVTMSQCVGETGKVFAFEPSMKTYRELIYNLAANSCFNTYAIHAAIGKDKNIIDVVVSHPNNEGGSYVINSRGGTDRALQLPLDAFNFNNVSFIKIDVENMEADVLDGAVSTINRNKPVILIEIQGNGERPIQQNEDTKKMAVISRNKIKKLGYNLTYLGGADYLAIPKD